MTSRPTSPLLSLLRAGAAVLMLACAAFPALAEKADRTKPMNIESDSMRYDDLKQTSVFTGNVVVTKGTIIIRGARIDVRQDPEGYQYGTVIAEPGKRAFFRQKRDTLAGQPDEFVEGEAEVIEYDGKADNVRLIRRGELRRSRGTTLTDEITGAVIVYNNLTDVFTVDGQARAPGVAAAPGGRVRAVLAPKDQPPAPPAAPAANLRPSTTIESNQ